MWTWITLSTLLALMAWQDIQHRRIPNRLLGVFALIGSLLAVLPGGIGLASSLGAAAMALTICTPIYLMRHIGGGDLKLITTVGLLVGAHRITAVCLSIAMAGGLLALWWLWRNHGQTVTCPAPFARMPYAVAIALGTASHGLWNDATLMA